MNRPPFGPDDVFLPEGKRTGTTIDAIVVVGAWVVLLVSIGCSL